MPSSRSAVPPTVSCSGATAFKVFETLLGLDGAGKT